MPGMAGLPAPHEDGKKGAPGPSMELLSLEAPKISLWSRHRGSHCCSARRCGEPAPADHGVKAEDMSLEVLGHVQALDQRPG